MNDILFIIPKMCDEAYILKATLDFFGIDSETTDEPDITSIEYSEKFTTGKECYPCILTTGDLIKIAKRDYKNYKQVYYFMPTTTGPCRFGQYSNLQKMILKELESDIKIFSPNEADHEFYNNLNIDGKLFFKIVWEGIITVEIIKKILHRIRANEEREGESDRLYNDSLMRLTEAIRRGDNILDIAKGVANDFKNLSYCKKIGSKPLVGMVGEIYVRLNDFANDYIIKKLNTMQIEVYLSPFSEWIYYTNYINYRKLIKSKKFKQAFINRIKNRFQVKTHYKISKIFSSIIDNAFEPPIKESLKHASNYYDIRLEGEAILTLSKTLEFINSNLNGIVNVNPFYCMPGTNAYALLLQVKKQYKNIPMLHLFFDASSENIDEIAFETFVYQVYSNSKKQNN